MSYQHGSGRSTETWIGGQVGGASAGKRTLTGQLQLRARGDVTAAAEDPVTNYHGLEHSTVTADAQSIAAHGISGAATALPYADQIQKSFGRHDISGIDAHMGGAAGEATAALGAHGYATGSSVAFAGAPSLHTAAHEAAHVIQQRAGVHLKGGVGEVGDTHERHADAVADAVVRGESAEALLDQYSGSGGGGGGVQFDLVRPAEVMAGMGTFNVNFVTRNAATPGPGQRASLDGFIQFTPMAGAPNSNTIGITQIVKGTNAGNPASDRGAASLPPGVMPRGALGQPGLNTADDAATGVVGGFHTDVLHTGGGGGLHAPGTALSPRYAVEPTTPANQAGAWGGQTLGPRGGIGGIGEQSAGGLTPGFKRSDLPEDIRSVQLYDAPASSGEADFEFESVVRGEDTNTVYGTVLWGFGVRSGATTNEHISFAAGTSATFDNALERHRDFYTHEPVVIYFAFDRDNVDAVQQAKIAGLAGYLGRNPAVVLTLDGFADIQGDAAYNVALSERRVTSVRNALAATHPALTAARIVSNTVVPAQGAAAAHPNAGGHGESTDATEAPASETPAGTGDQGGNAANGRDQTREANRQFNRRVTITFSHPAGTGPGAPGGVGNPAPAAPPAGP